MATKNANKVEASGTEVNKSQMIKDILAVTPDRAPKDIADELTAKGIPVKPNYVSTIKTNMKAQGGAAKGKAKAKKTASKAAPKAARSAKPAPKSAESLNITFDQLRMAKDMARQLGGAEKAREVLGALLQLSE
ncbi:MAG: hypothetical protein KJ000_24605 [Pirellulaceae bacterium]|nr:hypothetical protein [Pirellulaceae bacterium]